MTEFNRYAVYYAPEPGDLAYFAAAWLGWDAAAGVARAHPELAGLPLPVADITATPRKYGFHGTIKPPFRLANGSSRAALAQDLADLASRLRPATMDGLTLHRLGRFLALTPSGDTAALAAMAGHVVQALDHHRAPALPDELARRRAAGLTPAQDQNVTKWGYPYVMDEFRFHLTLTGKLPKTDVQRVADALRPALSPLLPCPFRVNSLCLFGEAADGMFHLLHRYALTG